MARFACWPSDWFHVASSPGQLLCVLLALFYFRLLAEVFLSCSLDLSVVSEGKKATNKDSSFNEFR